MVKSNDFEVHDIGTATELRLCRELIEIMVQMSKQYGRGIFHKTVADKLDELVLFYNRSMENERYNNGI